LSRRKRPPAASSCRKRPRRNLYAKYAGTEVKLEPEKKVLILRESDILAIVEK
jgi:co-chaperonin GroES (HSP10)